MQQTVSDSCYLQCLLLKPECENYVNVSHLALFYAPFFPFHALVNHPSSGYRGVTVLQKKFMQSHRYDVLLSFF